MLISRDVVLTYINDLGMTLSMSRIGPFRLWECREQMENSIHSEKSPAWTVRCLRICQKTLGIWRLQALLMQWPVGGS